MCDLFSWFETDTSATPVALLPFEVDQTVTRSTGVRGQVRSDRTAGLSTLV